MEDVISCGFRINADGLRLIYGKFLKYSDVRAALELSYSEKARLAHLVVQESIRVAESLFGEVKASVSFSGGKGSLVVLDIVLQHIPADRLYVVFMNTRNEYPGNREYVIKTVKDHFGVKHFVEVMPKFTPWDIWKMFGFPPPGRDRYYTPLCCVFLKELPMKYVVEKYGINLDFTGIQASEAFHRLRSIADYGLVRRTKYIGREVTLKKAIIRAMPIGLWTDEDVWKYIEERGLPKNPVYEMYSLNRQGCVACTNTKSWKETLERFNPAWVKLIEKRMEEWGIQKDRIRLRKLNRFLDVVDQIYEYREYFD